MMDHLGNVNITLCQHFVVFIVYLTINLGVLP